jgi:hypothetical protein
MGMYELRKYGSIRTHAVTPKRAFVSAIRRVDGSGTKKSRPVRGFKGEVRNSETYRPSPKTVVLVSSTWDGRLTRRKGNIDNGCNNGCGYKVICARRSLEVLSEAACIYDAKFIQ